MPFIRGAAIASCFRLSDKAVEREEVINFHLKRHTFMDQAETITHLEAKLATDNNAKACQVVKENVDKIVTTWHDLKHVSRLEIAASIGFMVGNNNKLTGRLADLQRTCIADCYLDEKVLTKLK